MLYILVLHYIAEVIKGNCVLVFAVLLGSKAQYLHLSFQAKACILECLPLHLTQLQHKHYLLYTTSQGILLGNSFTTHMYHVFGIYPFLFLCYATLTRTSQFIIGLNKYLEAVSHGFSVGMRFKMKFEGEESPERRFLETFRVSVRKLFPHM